MKHKIWLMLFCSLLVFTGTLSTGCSRKSGCPAYESAQTKTNRKGQLPTKRGNSNLFPKDMRRN